MNAKASTIDARSHELGVIATPLAPNDRVDILGVGVSPTGIDGAVATIESWIAARRKNYVCVTDAHCVIEARCNAPFRRVYENAGMAMADGLPLVWLSHLLGERRTQRVRGTDLMRAMTAVSARRGYRQFYYGGAEGVGDKLRVAMTAGYPGLNVAGVCCPPFRALSPAEDAAITEEINAARPDILWVGLGAPKQELWMANHLDRIGAPVMIGVGAAFDFLTGAKPHAPQWMQQSGLEWLFRLGSEPRRLTRRYAHVVPQFLALAACELARRSFDPEKKPDQPTGATH